MADTTSGGGGGAGGAGQVAGLDVVVTAPGVAQTKQDVVGSLSEMSAAAKSNAEAVDANRAAYQQWRQESDATRKQQAALAESGLTLDEVIGKLNGSVRDNTQSVKDNATALYDTRAVALQHADALQLVGSRYDDNRNIVLQHAAALDLTGNRYEDNRQIVMAHAAALEMDGQMAQQVGTMYADNRAIVLAHAQALEMDAAMQEANTAAAGAHGLQLGRLNMELGTFIGRLTGTNTAVTRLSAMLGGAVAGYGSMIAILAGVAGTLWIWDKLTGSTNEAQKAQERLTKSLEDWYAVEQRGVGGERLQQLDAEIAKVQSLTQQYERLKDVSPDNLGSGDPGALAFASAAQERAGQLKTQIDQGNGAIAAGEADTNAKIAKAINERETQYVNDLAHLVKYRAATADEQAKVAFMLQDFQQQLDGAAKSASPEFRNQLIQWIETLKNAEAAADKVHVASPDIVHGEDPTVKALLSQLAAMQKVNEANNLEAVQTQNAIELRHADAASRELLANDQKAEADRLKAMHEFSGVALTDRLAAIEAIRQQNAVEIEAEQAAKHAQDAQDFLSASMGQVTKIGEQNALKMGAQADAALKWAADNQKLADTIQKDLLHAIEQFTSRGGESWHAFFQDAANLSLQFTQLFDSHVKTQQAEFDAAEKAKNTTLAKQIAGRIEELKQYANAAKEIGTFVSAGVAGYNIGASTANSATGFLGGAAEGAAAGSAFGPWGAAIGGLVGAAGGLLGAASAQKEAAAAQLKAQEQAAVSLAQFNVQAGTGTALSVSTAQAKQAEQNLEDTINAALPGLKNQAERERELAQARQDLTVITQKLADADRQAQQAALDSANARLDTAIGDTDDAARLSMYIQHVKELNDAINQFGQDSAVVTALIQAQNAETAKLIQQQAEAHQQTDLTLAARKAAAEGDQKLADQLTRQAAEQKEVADAIAQGWTADEIAALQLTQALEDQKKAQDDAAAATERYTKNVAGLTAQFLALTGNQNGADLASLAEQQREALNSATQAGATPGEIAMLQVVQMFQTSQLEAKQAIQAQTDAINAQLAVANKQLQTAQQQLQVDQQAAQSLTQYRDSLATGSLSALSPADQLAAAKARRDALFAKAQAGDASAASAYGSADQTFLQLDKAFYGSGSQYASDFAQSQQQASFLADKFSQQASIDQQMVDSLQHQIDLLQQQLATLQNANTLAQQTKEGVIAQLKAQQDASLAVTGPLIDQFAALRDTLTGVGRDITGAEHDTLLGDQNTLQQVTAQEIAAIQNGASLQQIAQDEQIRQLDLQKSAQDAYYAQQLQETAKIYGWDSPQVQAIEVLQAKYDAGVQNQINAINGLGPTIGGLIAAALPQHEVPTPAGGSGPTLPGASGGINPPTLPPSTLPTYPGGFTLSAFASGGDFGGGLRLVGEAGPELEITGPSRIASNADLSQMFARALNGNADSAAALKALGSKMDKVVAVLVAMGAMHEDKLDDVVQQLEQGNKEAVRARRKSA